MTRKRRVYTGEVHFEPVQRHVVTLPNGKKEVFVTELSPVQHKLLRLLKLPPKNYSS